MGLKTSIAKEWYRLRTAQRLAKDEWRSQYWYGQDGDRIVPCRRCPKFDSRRAACGVPYGTPLRKCVVAAIDAHLHDTRGLNTLEIGFNRRSLAKHVIECSGGSWTGIEPRFDAARSPRLGQAGYGHAADIPFAADTFDLVFGIQSLEHWGEPLPGIDTEPTHEAALEEVWRVLKPGGRLYLDAPIHLHGHEMFVVGDLARVRRLFDAERWEQLVFEKWRFDREPLERYPTPNKDAAGWAQAIESYPEQQLEDILRNASVWLLTVTARKRPQPAVGESETNRS